MEIVENARPAYQISNVIMFPELCYKCSPTVCLLRKKGITLLTALHQSLDT
jgi:hypothetical protein